MRHVSLLLVLALMLGAAAAATKAEDLFGIPPCSAAPGNSCSTRDVLTPLPPVFDCPPRLLDRRQNSLFPSSVDSPYESPLFFPQRITRPLTGTPLLPERTTFVPGVTSSVVSPGFQRSLGRHSQFAPATPAEISAHAPPWAQLPTPAQLKGHVYQAVPHQSDCQSCDVLFSSEDFSADPFYNGCWNPYAELGVYGGKRLNDVQRPAIEWGLPFYDNGPIPRSGTGLGLTNLTQPKFYVYGDFRTAVAYNQNVANEQTIWASRLNLDLDLAITSTERIHMFWGPLDEGLQFTSLIYDNGEIFRNDAWDGFDERTDTLFFEGDLGAILGGFGGFYPKLDLPFAVGLIPLVLQNGIWIEDAFWGAAATIPARNKPWLDWSNFDTTFFIGFDEVTNNLAFQGDNGAANIIGATTFIERRRGYLEIGYAYLDDTADQGRSYHNVGISYTRRYLNLVSNSARVIFNTGQAGPRDNRTADGVLLLLENSFLTRNPYNVIPYANFFAGFGTPQSAARLQGPLKNTGINFESDLLTGYPILDDSANDTYGGAIGIDLLGGGFEQQLILELAFLQTMNNDASRIAPGDQYAIGARYQRPLSHTLLIRADAMAGWLENSDDIAGGRIELRRKF